MVLLLVTIIYNGSSPRYSLVRKVRLLEQQVEKLHEGIRLLEVLDAGGTKANEFHYDLSPPSTQKISRCETIHIAMVAAGYNTSRNVVTVVKSILFYRRNPLHFHFVSDAQAKITLSTIFETWQLPAIEVSIYSAEEAAKQVSWIPNFHYSGIYGLLKLTLTEALPPHVDRIIVLDTDVTVCADVAELWQFFALMRQAGKLLGLVENQSDWYLGNLWERHRPWPALGRGVNTGVMLLHLGALRSAEWRSTWANVTRKVLRSYKSAALADQDVINAVVKDTPDVHYLLPCTWNVQLSEHALSEHCLRDAEEYKLVHWNSPMKQGVRNDHAPYFSSLHRTFQQYDGNLMKNMLTSCYHNNTEAPKGDVGNTDPCRDIRLGQTLKFRTHPFFLHHDFHPGGDHDVTLVAQLSMDRVHMLDPLCSHWRGPISLVLYASDSEASEFLDLVGTHLPLMSRRKNVAFHIVYKDPRSHMYPVNYLRNVALRFVNTQHVYLSDIDFLPSLGLQDHLQDVLQSMSSEEEKVALVVPAFETFLYRVDFPQNKSQLLDMISKGKISSFRADVWSKGHRATDFERWCTAIAPYRVKWQEDYEPYVVVRSSVTPYDTRFAGFGWNKVSHIMALHAQGYEFVVLPNSFMVHMPHAPSLDIGRFRWSKHYRDCLMVLKREYQTELVRKYGAQFS